MLLDSALQYSLDEGGMSVISIQMVARSNREFKKILGVALGGGRGKNTIVSCIDMTGLKPTVVMTGSRDSMSRPWYDDVLVSYVMENPEETLLAVDAPLTIPGCVRCSQDICTGLQDCPLPSVQWFLKFPKLMERSSGGKDGTKPGFSPYTQRVCEKFLENEYGVELRESLGHSMGPLTARAQHLTRRWAYGYKLNENLLEVSPHATVMLAFGKNMAFDYRRGPAVWETRAFILEECGKWFDFAVWRESILQSRRRFKSVISAFTALLWLQQEWVLPEGMSEIAAQDGWIWVPANGL